MIGQSIKSVFNTTDKMFNAHVEDEAHYERDPVNPNFLKRKPNGALLNANVQLPDSSEEVELDDEALKIAKKKLTNEQDAIKFVWLIQNYKQALLQHFHVNDVDEIYVDTSFKKSLDDLYDAVRERSKYPTFQPSEKKPKIVTATMNPEAVETMAELIKNQIKDRKDLDRFSTYENLQKAQAAFVYQETGKTVDEDQISDIFVKLTSGTPKYRNLYNALYSVVDPEQRIVQEMENVLDPLVQEAMQPLYNFMGCIDAVERYAAKHYKHFYPLKKNNKTLAEFQRNNKHLGNELLVMAADYARELAGYEKPIDKRNLTLIGQNVTFPTLTVKEKDLISPEVLDLLMPGAPQWIYCMCGSATIRFMLSFTTYGAMQMAAQELNLPDDLKAIIDSTDVSHKFAEYVAHKFFTAQGGMAQVSGISGDSLQYRISSGFNTTRQANHKWLLGCKLWFKNVYWSTNPKRAENIQKTEEQVQQSRDEYERQMDNLDTMLTTVTTLDKYTLTPADFDTLRREGIQNPNDAIGQSQIVKQSKLAWKEAEIARIMARCQPERVLRHSPNPSRAELLRGTVFGDTL